MPPLDGKYMMGWLLRSGLRVLRSEIENVETTGGNELVVEATELLVALLDDIAVLTCAVLDDTIGVLLETRSEVELGIMLVEGSGVELGSSVEELPGVAIEVVAALSGVDELSGVATEDVEVLPSVDELSGVGSSELAGVAEGVVVDPKDAGDEEATGVVLEETIGVLNDVSKLLLSGVTMGVVLARSNDANPDILGLHGFFVAAAVVSRRMAAAMRP
ncbi:unnamed protein product [Clonostachys rosea]|uniref:Uncharacterized protein n=1 Tax=Bionectria ochroleuca TaxID=29856 RepID=A0ABY6UDS7_BIOOC|nr:unnamed protein product [Clonostachys rosea]